MEALMNEMAVPVKTYRIPTCFDPPRAAAPAASCIPCHQQMNNTFPPLHSHGRGAHKRMRCESSPPLGTLPFALSSPRNPKTLARRRPQR